MKNIFLAVCTALILLVSFFSYDSSLTGNVFEEYEHWGMVGQGTYNKRNVAFNTVESFDLDYSKTSPLNYYLYLDEKFTKDPSELDFNKDGVVSQGDLNVLMIVLGRVSGDNRGVTYTMLDKELRQHGFWYLQPASQYDINGDGYVTKYDYNILFYYIYEPQPQGSTGYTAWDYGTRGRPSQPEGTR